MLNNLAKFLLVLTALSPVLGAAAIDQFEHGEPWASWSICLVVIALLLVLACWALLKYAAKNAQRYVFHVKEFVRKDQEMLTFLFIYLLPFLRSGTFASDWLMSIYILGILTLAIAHADAFHFNPVMRLLGFRFYAVKNQEGVTNLLISKKDLRQPNEEIQTVRLAPDVYLHTGVEDA